MLILLVEDESNDVLLVRRALLKAGLSAELRVASDGQVAIDYLAGAGEYADRRGHPLPDLVLLDLKLPLKSGLEVLQWMRSKSHLDRVAVVILTSSRESRDVERAYALHCEAYLMKPSAFPDLVERMRALGRRLGILSTPGPTLGDFSEPPPLD